MRSIEVREYGPPDVLKPTESTEPTPSEGELCIDVAAAGLNFADVEKRRGRYPNGPEPTYVPGIEVSGTVVETGDDTAFEAGDDVAAFVEGGGYAERVVAPEETAFEVPDAISTRDAAGFPVQFLTAHNALFEWGGLEPGDRVLINAAAGGVGTAAVQIAAATPDVEVFGTASTPEKLALAERLGADHAINYTDASVSKRLRELTEREGVDLVLDGVGGEAFYESLDGLADFGRVVSYGMASGEVPSVSLPRLLFTNKSVVGYHLGHALSTRPERVKRAIPELRSLLAGSDVDVHVGETFALEAAASAHAALEDRESTGKVLLVP
ncbi:quinone oxidoreductase family protein [Halomicrobium salinisoli]|uniref:quinone oxidoreductase family protein n=1 Tax=Halomicrobium salinisoli TaxID=2878391 RepID=UPI001CEFDFDC|nr:NADPH:quinone oxidoreductase family protein [Halomicrobium salinisoli]